MTTIYNGSKGPVEIATMAYRHLVSAHAKLIRDGLEKERAPEIAAMAARIAELDAEYAASQEAAAQAEPAPEPIDETGFGEVRAEVMF